MLKRKKRLTVNKRQEYDDLCDKIRELSLEYDLLDKEKKDITEINKRLGMLLDKCFAFVRREYYNKN
ncbi:hypothetical protein [Sporomusa termitida]|uniref:Uncharacterized protein n=1 Tax=Sporomusa termitida TaxID=2377 RepID=A0A517DT87_9FIRM|nr:hypothetical protein [Sporomusa termitida]QDR80573.1 hypothetical protein SPTER_19020 [Sporomusa termitida]